MDQSTNQNEIELVPDQIEVKTITETIVKDEDVAQPIQSPNFKQNTTGWKLGSNGLLEANGAKMSTVGSGSFYASSDGATFNIIVSYVDGVITTIT